MDNRQPLFAGISEFWICLSYSGRNDNNTTCGNMRSIVADENLHSHTAKVIQDRGILLIGSRNLKASIFQKLCDH